jgi:hypothetical protein
MNYTLPTAVEVPPRELRHRSGHLSAICSARESGVFRVLKPAQQQASSAFFQWSKAKGTPSVTFP